MNGIGEQFTNPAIFLTDSSLVFAGMRGDFLPLRVYRLNNNLTLYQFVTANELFLQHTIAARASLLA